MELNREQIIKALECCTKGLDCEMCPLFKSPHCSTEMQEAALSLIKELTEKSKIFEQAYDCMNSACRELSSKCDRLAEENERLRAERDVLDTLVKDLSGRNKGLQRANESLAKDCDILEDELNECVQIKADTVRKMQELIAEHATNGYPRKVRLDVVDQIAKELLEETK